MADAKTRSSAPWSFDGRGLVDLGGNKYGMGFMGAVDELTKMLELRQPAAALAKTACCQARGAGVVRKKISGAPRCWGCRDRSRLRIPKRQQAAAVQGLRHGGWDECRWKAGWKKKRAGRGNPITAPRPGIASLQRQSEKNNFEF